MACHQGCTYHFCHEGEGAAVVEVKVGDDDAVDVAGEGVAAQPGALLLLGDVAGGQFNRHYELWARNRAQNWAVFWVKLSTSGTFN